MIHRRHQPARQGSGGDLGSPRRRALSSNIASVAMSGPSIYRSSMFDGGEAKEWSISLLVLATCL